MAAFDNRFSHAQLEENFERSSTIVDTPKPPIDHRLFYQTNTPCLCVQMNTQTENLERVYIFETGAVWMLLWNMQSVTVTLFTCYLKYC